MASDRPAIDLTPFGGIPNANTPGVPAAKIILGLLSVSFVITSLLAFRHSNMLIRIFYTISAVWLGMLSFFFLAASLSWLTYAAKVLLGLSFHKQTIALLFNWVGWGVLRFPSFSNY